MKKTYSLGQSFTDNVEWRYYVYLPSVFQINVSIITPSGAPLMYILCGYISFPSFFKQTGQSLYVNFKENTFFELDEISVRGK